MNCAHEAPITYGAVGRRVTLLLVISALMPAVGCAQERPHLPRGHEPAPHADGGEAAWPEPAVVFDSLWSAFHHTYALFEDKSVPWRAVGDAYRPRALRATTEEELFDVLAEMLATLNDNHVKLTGWSRIMSAAGDLRYAGPPEDFSTELIRQHYLLAAPQERAGGSIAFGWLPDSVGYVHITRMADVRASADALDEALATFADARGVVLDLRRNSGGDDPVGQALASRFADRPRHYMTTRLKSGRGADDFTAPRYWNIEPPAGGGFTRPVAVLTHQFTFSAGENFLLALRVLPHVTVVGTRTSGSMGETTNDVLPNGWVYRTVMARIVDADGRSWEGIGIPPQLRVVNSPEEIRGGRDRVLEAGMSLVSSRGAATAAATAAPSDATASVRLPLADSLAVWIEERGLAPALERFQRLRADIARWFLAEDWEYGDLTTLGRGFLQEDEVDAAVAVLEATAIAYPRSYRPHLWLARAHERAGRDREADIARRRAISLNPEAYSADRRAAVELSGRIPLSYLFLDRLFGEGVDAAVRTYRMTKAEHPERVDIDPLVLVRGGQQLREAGQSEAARDVFAFIVDEFPRSTIAHLGLAQALRDLGDVDAARQAYRRAVAVDPGNRAAREGLASLASP
ncbi:MAG TPA: S41 family peptidase [Longimicrobiales bacterium]|nr:S41 family peptidase [Longimicrobiales bacterium]